MKELVNMLGFQQLQFLLDREKEQMAELSKRLDRQQEMWQGLADCFTRLLCAVFQDDGTKQREYNHHRMSTEAALEIIGRLHRKAGEI